MNSAQESQAKATDARLPRAVRQRVNWKKGFMDERTEQGAAGARVRANAARDWAEWGTKDIARGPRDGDDRGLNARRRRRHRIGSAQAGEIADAGPDGRGGRQDESGRRLKCE